MNGKKTSGYAWSMTLIYDVLLKWLEVVFLKVFKIDKHCLIFFSVPFLAKAGIIKLYVITKKMILKSSIFNVLQNNLKKLIWRNIGRMNTTILQKLQYLSTIIIIFSIAMLSI